MGERMAEILQLLEPLVFPGTDFASGDNARSDSDNRADTRGAEPEI